MSIEKVTTYYGPDDPFVRMTTEYVGGDTINVEIVARAYLPCIKVTCEYVTMPWYRRILPTWLNAKLSGWLAVRAIRRCLKESK